MQKKDDTPPVLRLLPAGNNLPQPLAGLYLNADLPDTGRAGPWVYSNFVTTLDGRISLIDPATGIETVPPDIADPRDWRLFQELACRADILITSGRYLRDLKAGTAQDILPLSNAADFQDLHAWRAQHGLRAQPDIAILSVRLDFDIPPLLLRQGRSVTILTTSNASPDAIRRLEQAGGRVRCVNDGDQVSGKAAINHLGGLGYKRIYSVTGPYVLHTLVEDDVLDTLFLTWRHRILGGSGSTFISGPALAPAVDLRLSALYQDLAAESAGQCFARFDRP